MKGVCCRVYIEINSVKRTFEPSIPLSRNPVFANGVDLIRRADIYFYGSIIGDADLFLNDDCCFYGLQRLWGQH